MDRFFKQLLRSCEPQKLIIAPPPLTDAEVLKTLSDMEDIIRYRLRMTEIIPVEMSRYRIGKLFPLPHSTPFPLDILSSYLMDLHMKHALNILNSIADGRVHFIIPKLFSTSLCLRGAQNDDGWFFVHVEFPISVGGDLTGMQGTSNSPVLS